MKKNNLYWHFGVYIAIYLSGFSLAVSEETRPYGFGLIVLASLLILIYFSIIKIKLLPSFYIYENGIDKRNKAYELTDRIFQEASVEGGELYSTHIFPFDNDYKKDLAIKNLEKFNNSNSLTFERLLIVENRDIEDQWIEEIFTKLPSKIGISIHLLNPYPLLINRFSKAVIPRLNLLLYKKDNRYYSIIGLDKLQILNRKEVNFSVVFRNKKVFELLRDYFQNLTAFGGITEIKSKQEFELNNLSPLPKGYHGTINKIIRLAEQNVDILFVGIFGSLAKYLTGYYTGPHQIDKEYDIDFVILCNPDKENNIIAAIKAKLVDSEYKTVINIKDKSFYSWRDKTKLNVDIELFSITSDFFQQKQLLSRSILRYFLKLYSYQNKSFSEHISIDTTPISSAVRFDHLLNCQKGVAEFEEHLEKSDGTSDPRRLTSQLVRNLVWAETGDFPLDYRVATDFLEDNWSENFNDCSIKRIRNLTSKSSEDLKKNLPAYYKTVEDLINDIKNYAQQLSVLMACNAQSEPGVDGTGFETGTYTMGFSISGMVVFRGMVVYLLLLSWLVGACFSVLSVISSLLFPVRFPMYLLTFYNWAKLRPVPVSGLFYKVNQQV